MRLQCIQGFKAGASFCSCIVNISVTFHRYCRGFSVGWAETLVLGWDSVILLLKWCIQISRNCPLSFLRNVVIAMFWLCFCYSCCCSCDYWCSVSHCVFLKQSIIDSVSSNPTSKQNFLWFLYLLCTFSTLPRPAGVLLSARLYFLSGRWIFKGSAHGQSERARTTWSALVMNNDLFQRIVQSVRIAPLMMNYWLPF